MRLLWRIYIYYFTSTLLALAATTWYANHSLRQFYQEQVAADLLTRANVLASELGTHSVDKEAEQINQHCKEFRRLTQTRATVILPDGRVIGDSDQSPSSMENHRNRPEIAEALTGLTGKSVRFSDTIRHTLMYLAIPMQRDGTVVAVVRTSLPLSVIDWTLHTVYRHIAFGGLIVVAFFAVAAFYLARRISRPLDDMRRIADRLAHGDLHARVALPKGVEMKSLARALNQMAAQLNERIETITRQSQEQEAVFSSMIEGVLAVDGDGRILHLNSAAARLLDLTPDRVRGRSIQETVRHVELQKFISVTLATGRPRGNGNRPLRQRGTFPAASWDGLDGPSGQEVGSTGCSERHYPDEATGDCAAGLRR